MKLWRNVLPRPFLSGVLALLWLMLNNSLTPIQILIALLMGWLLPLALNKFLIRFPKITKPLLLIRFIFRVFIDIAVANFQVAMVILKSNRALKPVFVEVPLDSDDEFVIALLMTVITLTPGTLAAQLSADRRSLSVHALQCENPHELIAQLKHRYESPLRDIFG